MQRSMVMDEEAGSRIAGLMLAAAAGGVRGNDGDDDDEVGGEEQGDAKPQPAVQKPVRILKSQLHIKLTIDSTIALTLENSGQSFKSKSGRIGIGPQAPARTVRPVSMHTF